MSQITPQLRKMAVLLLSYEMRVNLTQAIRRPASYLVCEKLRPPLSTLMGNAGFCALLSRAQALANTEAPGQGVVRVKADGTLDGLELFAVRVTRKEFAEAGVVLIGRLIGLLVAFIGEELTFRLLREVWPDVTLNPDLSMTEENK